MRLFVIWPLALISVFLPGFQIARSADAAAARRGNSSGRPHEITVYTLSPNGKLLAVGSKDHNVRLWGVASGRLIHTFHGHTAAISSLAFSADSAMLAAGAPDDTVRLWSVVSGRTGVVLKGTMGNTSTLLFSPDGSMLASDGIQVPGAAGSAEEIPPVTVLWSTRSGQRRSVLKPPHRAPTPALFSLDSTLLVTVGGFWDPAQVWDVHTGRNKFEAGSDFLTSVTAVNFSADGQTLAVAGWRNQGGEGQPEVVHFLKKVRTLDGQANEVLAAYTSPSLEGDFDPWTIALSRDGSLIADVTSGNRVILFNHKGKLLATLENASAPIVFSTDSTRLFALRHHKPVVVWDTRSGKAGATAAPAPSPIFPAHLTHKLTAAGSTITLWNSVTGRAARTFKQP